MKGRRIVLRILGLSSAAILAIDLGNISMARGVHEQWNNSIDKQFSRNLGKGIGVELVSIPEYLVKNNS